jgi:hypothetical protein
MPASMVLDLSEDSSKDSPAIPGGLSQITPARSSTHKLSTASAFFRLNIRDFSKAITHLKRS